MVAAEIFEEEEDDLLYEEDILRNSYSLKYWWRYIDAKKRSPPKQRNQIYERAIKYLPGSYKLWHAYLNDRREQVRGKVVTDPTHEHLNRTYERAIVFLHKCPRIWLDYLQFLMNQKKATRTRHTFDRALRALPITQHDRIWELYLKFVRELGVTETAVRVYRRYLKFEPDGMEDYIEFLLSVGRIGEAALKTAECLNRDNFVSFKGKSKHKMWLELCELISKNPQAVKGLRVEAILRGGLRSFTDEAGHLWCSLSDFFIRQAQFEKARDIYEEGITTVMTVRDFSMIFDAYTQFEESMISAKMETLENEETAATMDATELEEEREDLDIRLARLERLMERRPELLSSVLLRQNPHNVHEWLKRVELFKDTPARVIHTYATAVKTIDPHKALGKPTQLWVAFATYYEKHNDLKNARIIFKKATHVNYKTVEELSTVWCEWAEMELRNKKYQEALSVMQQATVIPPAINRRKKEEEAGPVQGRLYRNTKLWTFYADLEESLGTFESTKAVYDKMIDLKIVTPQIIINFATLLEENKYFEESFRAYEKGVANFNYPWVLEIWLVYLNKFVRRYKGTKLERARDLFEQALEKCPAKDSKTLYLLYAKLEEEYGLARHAMEIYDRACKTVEPDQKYDVYLVYITKAADFYGVTKTRDIYEQAIATLPPDPVREMCIRYAQLERKLGEIDRARAIYLHAAQDADPQIETGNKLWDTWHDFEVHHGNEDTFREMLRIKRSVKATFTSGNFVASGLMEEMMETAQDVSKEVKETAEMFAGETRKRGLNEPEDEQASKIAKVGDDYIAAHCFQGAREGYAFKLGDQGLGYYRDARQEAEARKAAYLKEASEEIALPEEGDDDVGIEQVEVPAAVFGAALGAGDQEPMGAMERMKRARQK